MRLALQTLAVVAAGTLVGVGANALSPRPTLLGEAVHARAESPGMCAAPPASAPPPAFTPPPAPFAPASPAPFAPAGTVADPAASPISCPECGRATLVAGGAAACGSCHAAPGAAAVLR